ncbi:VOC family protein [Mycolicibacterium baixiangningiae]|uniref:VOC family protein n=1 Tax=Mycolicibacterium baixiangningiae TaxID=2761578 RepID=UPI001867690A|nr:VOC family protein [Mycolicibacterium baixiangningiae]
MTLYELPVTGAVFDHVAIAAPRIADLTPLYIEVLGGQIIYTGEDDPDYGFRVIHVGFKDGTKVELMEPSTQSTFFDSFFRRNPEGGLHHVTFLVDDVNVAAAACSAAGYQVFGVRRQSGWNECFLHPRSTCGTLVQLADMATS